MLLLIFAVGFKQNVYDFFYDLMRLDYYITLTSIKEGGAGAHNYLQ